MLDMIDVIALIITLSSDCGSTEKLKQLTCLKNIIMYYNIYRGMIKYLI